MSIEEIQDVLIKEFHACEDGDWRWYLNNYQDLAQIWSRLPSHDMEWLLDTFPSIPKYHPLREIVLPFVTEHQRMTKLLERRYGTYTPKSIKDYWLK